MSLLILIADDDPGIRLAVSDFLEMSGYDVITADNGREALNLLENYHPHLFISDIKMPGKNGYELIKNLRQKPEFRLLPVIFLTHKNNTEERIKGYESGCDVYLPKPFEMVELLAIIRNLLERSHLIQAELLHSQQKTEFTNLKLTQEQPYLDFDFTPREQQVLNLLTQGLSNIEIGENLYLSSRTIEKYVTSLLRKTNTTNRSELVSFAFKHNLML
jgi:DNA-binding NarL/FixJ family response regulator